jgi:HlyD family secretion protein
MTCRKNLIAMPAISSALAGIVLVASSGCGNLATGNPGTAHASPPTTAEALPRVQTITVAAQDLQQSIELPATIEGFENAELYAKIGGYLDSVAVDIGDRVKKGDQLARLAIPEMEKELLQKQAAIAAAQSEVGQAEAAIHQAEAMVKSAEADVEEARSQLLQYRSQVDFRDAEFARIKPLVDRGSLNRELLDEVVFKRDSARAAVEAAKAGIRADQADLIAKRTNVDKAASDRQSAQSRVALANADHERVEALLMYSTILAPFDGVITRRMMDPGAFVQPAEGNSAAKPLFSISRTDKIRVVLYLPMAEVRWLDRGDKALLNRINVLPSEQFEGEVTRFAAALDQQSRTMRVEVHLPNPENRLLPGYYGYVTLMLEQFEQVPVIPSSALLVDSGQESVFVVENGVCHRRDIVTGYKDGSIVGVVSGLSAGDAVVRAGGGQLVDGQQVVAVNAENAD